MDLMPREYKKKNGSAVGGNGSPAGGFNASQKIKSPAGPAAIIVIFLLLIVSLAAYGALVFYKYKINKEIEADRKSYNEIVARQDKDLLKRIVVQGKSARLLADLLKSRRRASNVFKALSEITLPQVQWESFSLAEEGNSVILSGNSANYTVLARQMTAFKNDENWLKADFSSIALDKTGTVSFSAKLEFAPNLLIGK